MIEQLSGMTGPALLMLGMFAVGVAAFVLVFAGWEPVSAWCKHSWRRYANWVNGELRTIYSPIRAQKFVVIHIGASLFGLLLGLLFGSWLYGVFLAVLVGYLPVGWLEREVRNRRRALEEQLDSTLQSLANTILVTQNLEEAFVTIAQHFDPPISQEADILIKQVRLGTPMDEALRDSALRCKSRSIDVIVTALTIGRQTGGELPKMLETIASVLREALRVEGVMDAKTSQGKAEVVLMSALPVLFGGAVYLIYPAWMAPLFHDPVGWGVLAVAGLFWIVGVTMVRKISTINV